MKGTKTTIEREDHVFVHSIRDEEGKFIGFSVDEFVTREAADAAIADEVAASENVPEAPAAPVEEAAPAPVEESPAAPVEEAPAAPAEPVAPVVADPAAPAA